MAKELAEAVADLDAILHPLTNLIYSRRWSPGLPKALDDFLVHLELARHVYPGHPLAVHTAHSNLNASRTRLFELLRV